MKYKMPDTLRILGVEFKGKDIKNWREYCSVENILKEKNAEKARIMIAFLGIDKFLHQSGAKCIQEDDSGQLYRLDFNGEVFQYVRWVNSTVQEEYLGLTKEQRDEKLVTKDGRKIYFIEVPEDCKTAYEATAWTAGWTKKENGDYEFLYPELMPYMQKVGYSPEEEA